MMRARLTTKHPDPMPSPPVRPGAPLPGNPGGNPRPIIKPVNMETARPKPVPRPEVLPGNPGGNPPPKLIHDVGSAA